MFFNGNISHKTKGYDHSKVKGRAIILTLSSKAVIRSCNSVKNEQALYAAIFEKKCAKKMAENLHLGLGFRKRGQG
jgi:hypothetical protein